MYSLEWRQRLANVAVHNFMRTCNTRHVHAFTHRKLTGQSLREYCVANRVDHRRVSVPMAKGSKLDEPVLHFMSYPGQQSSGPTVLYAHGGGYLHPMMPHGHIPVGIHIAKSCNAQSLVFLEYTLLPHTQYPGELTQIVEAVRYLIQNGTSPSDLVIGGDSAGGHLITSLLAHIKEPAPSVPPLDLTGKQLRAAVLLSPWLSMTEAGQGTSAVINEKYDYLSRKMLSDLAELFKPTPTHIWAHPIDTHNAKSVWGKVFPRGRPAEAVVGRVIVTAGSAEILFDSCRRFAIEHVGAETVVMDGRKGASLYTIKKAPFVFAVGEGEVHVQPALDTALFYYRGRTTTALTEFLQSL